VLANNLYREVSDRYPNARAESLEIRGQEAPLDVHILTTR
jgi:hypothetical protein